MKTQVVLLLLSALAAVAVCSGDSSDSSDSSSSGGRRSPRCPALRPHSYGGYRPAKKYYSIGSKVHFFCKDGYALSGSSYAQCVYYKYRTFWKFPKSPPVCKPVFCPKLNDPRYGSVKVSGSRPGDVAIYSCNNGFDLVGTSKRVCLNFGQWSGDAPICKRITCPDLDDPRYGSVSTTGNNIGDKATYRCNKGFILVGNPKRTCQSNGEWSDREPICKPITCPDLDDPRYGSVSTTGNNIGDQATYRCNKGFILVGSSKRTCQSNGEWSDKEPICKPITCPDLDDPRNGIVRVTGNRFEDKATYRCNKGFKLKGSSERTCQSNGQWSGDAPICVPIVRDCGRLRDPKNGDVDFKCTTVGCTAWYSCDRGFVLKGNKDRRCQSNGQWSGSIPVCRPQSIDCGRLHAPRYGSVRFKCTTFRCHAYYDCDYGFKLVGGPRSRWCQKNGYWSDSQPRCVRKH